MEGATNNLFKTLHDVLANIVIVMMDGGDGNDGQLWGPLLGCILRHIFGLVYHTVLPDLCRAQAAQYDTPSRNYDASCVIVAGLV